MSTPVDEAAPGLSTAPAAPPPGPVTGRTGPRRVLVRGWRQLTSMRTALLLLFLLALASVPGSVLPQRGLNPIKVNDYLQAHPTLGSLLDRLGLFDVFAAPWFAAVYLLLFVSLVGCLLPRVRLHLKALRTPPPAAPRHLDRMRHHVTLETDLPPEEALAAARALLRRRRFRLRRAEPGAHEVAAEKGYLRETGNLLFHVSLVLLLTGVALGGLYGYKGTVLVSQGDGFANARSNYDTFSPGRLFRVSALRPFSFTMDSFRATYQPSGEAASFDATVSWRGTPTSPSRSYDIRVNHPLSVDGAKLYLVGHGYAPHFLVRDATGYTAFDGSVPFLPQTTTFASTGVLKVPDTTPRTDKVSDQLGFRGLFLPTLTSTPDGQVVSSFPGPRAPAVQLIGFRGDLGLDSGAVQSVYELVTRTMKPVADGSKDAAGKTLTGFEAMDASTRLLRPGQTWQLPGGGSVTFTGVDQWATFQVTHDPGKGLALLAAMGIVVGLLLSLRVRRRRVWVRVASPVGSADAAAGGRRTVLTVAGLSRTEADDVDEELAGLRDELSARVGGPRAAAPGGTGSPAEEE